MIFSSSPLRGRLRIIIGILGLLAILASCKGTEDHTEDAQIRYINLSVDINSIDVKTGSSADTTVASGVQFATATTYGYMGAGTTAFTLQKTSNSANLISAVSLALTKQVPYTLYYYGENNSSGSYALINDSEGSPSSGYIRVRVLDYAPGVSTLDVYITGPSTDLSSATASVTSLSSGSDSGYADYSNGDFRIRATLTGTKQVVYDSGTLSSSDKDIFAIALYTSGSGKLVNALRLPVNGSDGIKQVANTLAQVKFVNASSDSGSSALQANGTSLISSVPYGSISSYVTTASGSRSLTLVSSSNATVATLAQTLSPGIDYSVVAVGSNGAQELLALTDNNLPPSSGNARVRFVNVAQNSGNVDALANFTAQASSLAADTASSYVEVGEGTYSFTFNLSNTNTTLATLASQDITAARTYTVYLISNSGTYQAVLTRDD